MADKKIEVSEDLLKQMSEQMAEQERKMADIESKNAGLQEMLEKGGPSDDVSALKKKKSYEPKFRTVQIRKFPIAGNLEDMGYIIGWTNRGAYQEVDRGGVSPQVIDFIDVIFLGHEKTETGKIKAEKIKLLDLLNSSRVHCKILETKKETREVPTNEEINVTVWDPQHGLVETGDRVDGYVSYTDMTLKIQIPGIDKPVSIDAEFVN